MNRILLLTLTIVIYIASISPANGQDSIRVLIIYGSKPARGHSEEGKWFGGKPGGHVALQVGQDSVLSFHPTQYHPPRIFARHKRSKYKSKYDTQSVASTWATFKYASACCYTVDSLRSMVISIPLSPAQRAKLNSIIISYRDQSPYDYALFGMRC